MSKLEELMRLNNIKPKKDTPKEEPKITDELGNVYSQYIGTDGGIHLKLIESYNGELFE